MKRMGLVLGGVLAALGCAHAATLESDSHVAANARAAAAPLGATAIAQMSDNTPVVRGGASCSDYEAGITRDNSWWRRFYLNEHGVASSLSIESVTVGVESGSTPVMIRLYALPHGTAAGTIPTQQLRLIGRSAVTTVGGQLDTVTIPVSGTIGDTLADDLVVEFHTDGNPAQAFYAGGNASAQTHEAFISSNGCGIPQPTPMSAVDFPDAHMILVANASAPAIGVLQAFAPEIVIGAAPSTLTITLLNPLPTPAALQADFIDTLPPGLVIAPAPNAATSCGGTLSANSGAGSLSLSAAGAVIPANGRCTVRVDVTSEQAGSYTNRIVAGALHTDQGDNALAVEATLMVVPVGGNGIIHSGPLNRALAPTLSGTSFNIVSADFNDAGARDDRFDFNFSIGFNDAALAVLTLTFNAMPAGQAQYLVDADGNARMLQDGDAVGPDDLFSAVENVAADPAWLSGNEGVVGVRFACDGRLTYPVAGGFCYGYVRLATRGTSGYPARLLDATFDGDGGAITVVMPEAVDVPAASVLPAALAFRMPEGAIRTQTLTISNAPGSRPLNYAIAAQGESAAAMAFPLDVRGSSAQMPAMPREAAPLPRQHPRLPLSYSAADGHALAPWQVPGGIPFALDDGSYEAIVGLGQVPGVWLNRFSVFEPTTINSVAVLWPQQDEEGSLVGLQANLVAYYDADGDGDPSNAVRLGTDELVTIARLDHFDSYPTHFEVPGAGDVYIGFVEHWITNGYPLALSAAALDMHSFFGDSYLSINMPSDDEPSQLDLDHLGNNQFTGSLATLVGGYLGGNWLIRATATAAGCDGPPVPWLSATARRDPVRGGASAHVTIRADSSVADLKPGDHSAQLCIVTDDPDRRLIVVPVSLTVTVPNACAGPDVIFCDGFEEAVAVDDDIVGSGPLRLEVPRDSRGLSFNFARAEWSPQSFFGDDFALFWDSMTNQMLFHWFDEYIPGANGGVAQTLVGPYRSLRSGDTVGPDSIFSSASSGAGETADFITDAEGYLGVRFYNEETQQTNYGYVHVVTSWPGGFPVTIVGYAYNKAGGPIRIP